MSVLHDRLAEALLDAIEHSCQVTTMQLDQGNFGWATQAAGVVNDLTETFLRVADSVDP